MSYKDIIKTAGIRSAIARFLAKRDFSELESALNHAKQYNKELEQRNMSLKKELKKAKTHNLGRTLKGIAGGTIVGSALGAYAHKKLTDNSKDTPTNIYTNRA